MQATPRSQVDLPFIDAARLSVLGDAITLRDPAGRGPKPSLLLDRARGGIHIRGPFTIVQRYSVTPGEGRLFVEASRDENPLHTEDTVLSGAMTAARPILLAETILPRLRVRGLRVKYRAFARYDEPLTNLYRVTPQGDGCVKVEFEVRSGSVVAAEGHLQTAPLAALALPAAGRPALAPLQVEVLARFYQSLRIDPREGFETHGYGYPMAFLASLPSGEMVRHGGTGGLLNVLDLEFPEAAGPALDSESGPSVEVEPTRPRNLFRRVVARVAKDMVTYCQGYATVLLDFLKPGTDPRAHPARP